VHAGGRAEARRPGLPRCVHGCHGSRSAAAGARRPRDRIVVVEDLWRAVHARSERDADRIESDTREDSRRGRSRANRGVVARGRGEVAAAAREVSPVLTAVRRPLQPEAQMVRSGVVLLVVIAVYAGLKPRATDDVAQSISPAKPIDVTVSEGTSMSVA